MEPILGMNRGTVTRQDHRRLLAYQGVEVKSSEML